MNKKQGSVEYIIMQVLNLKLYLWILSTACRKIIQRIHCFTALQKRRITEKADSSRRQIMIQFSEQVNFQDWIIVF
ncbi:MAG: hypothetical protein DWQ05_01675 [Calditrichaeota bacterium]|nr:MAG: hypothetical protein DWQ05_01675 [Calditrichota bacterium]